MLYEIAPDVIPQGWCTDVELHLWGLFGKEQMETIRAHRGNG